MPVYNEKNKKKWTKDGRHYYYKCYYTDSTGNRKQKVSMMYLTSNEAKEAERDFLNKIEISDITDKKISFVKVYNEWLEYKSHQLKSTTFYSTKKNLDKHIYEHFKDYKLHAIKTNIIQEWINKLKESGTGLIYQNKIIGYFKEFLIYAKDNYEFDSKVISKVQKHRIESVDKVRESEWNFWTYEEFKQFIEVVDDKLYYTMFNFMYFTGMRLGEVIALNWNDLDLKRGTIRVNKNFTNKLGTNSKKIIDPKTKNSIRTVDLNNFLINLLSDYYNAESKLYNFNKNMFIFGNVKNVSPTSFARKLNEYINISKLEKRITPHGFRHSHVSLLIHLGCDSREVAERVGDTVPVIETTYYHMFPQKMKHTIEVLNNIK